MDQKMDQQSAPEKRIGWKKIGAIALKIAATLAVLGISYFLMIFMMLIMYSEGIITPLVILTIVMFPAFCLGMIWLKKRKKFLKIWSAVAAVLVVGLFVNVGIVKYEESITINTTPNIPVYEYLPFEEDSKIVKRDSKTLKLTEDLPRIDGAAALFPVYSAFVNAVYPDTVELYDGTFEYNNTVSGYRLLAEQETDIFIGVYPSEEQRDYAAACKTTFEYTPIGTEAFVFFVHKDNPIDSLTTEQIRDIYSGKITNWEEVGGRDEEIVAFQRNPGSGSQSMLERFMGDVPIMEAPTEQVNDLMIGIIDKVSDYKSRSNSIGFSFRFYVEGIIRNPDIKMVAIDGIAPTAENVRNGSYPVVTPIYAVTYQENPNENVDRLLQWILSEEGQEIIEASGYVGVAGDRD